MIHINCKFFGLSIEKKLNHRAPQNPPKKAACRIHLQRRPYPFNPFKYEMKAMEIFEADPGRVAIIIT